jgi:nicotinamidase-related amidase
VDEYTEPHWDRSALLTIDVQQDFTGADGAYPVQGTEQIVQPIRRLLTAYRTRRLPIVHVVRIYLSDGSNVDLVRRAGITMGGNMLAPGTRGLELVDDLKPSSEVTIDADMLLRGDLQCIGDAEWILYKPRWGAFYQTDLEQHLRSLMVDTLVISGCNFPNCPRATIYEASERDFRVVVAVDGVSGLYDRGARELEGMGAIVLRSDECVERLGAPTRQR